MIWIILGAVAVVAILGLIIFNVVVDSKVKSHGKKEVAAKEAKLKEKLQAQEVENKKEEPATDEVKEEVVEETPVEEPATDEVKEEVVEETAKEEVVEETTQEPDEEVEELLKDVPDVNDVEEKTEEPATEEVEDEIIEEEPVEEVPQEKPATKKAKKEVKEEAKEEVKEDKSQEEPAKEKKVPAYYIDTAEHKATGKWMLTPEGNDYYFAKLYASNGEMILQTERYKGVKGIKSGIVTIKKALEADNYEICKDKNNTWNFKLYALNNNLLCIGEGYPSKDSAESAFVSVKNFADSIEIVAEEIEITQEKMYSIDESSINPNGKWIVVEGEDKYLQAQLKANNGQVILVTENYKGINSLKSGLEALKKNIQAGNFGTRKDKRDNYNFKIFSENKRLLALGAGYSTQASCESAIVSVMRFASSPVIFNNQKDTVEDAE